MGTVAPLKEELLVRRGRSKPSEWLFYGAKLAGILHWQREQASTGLCLESAIDPEPTLAATQLKQLFLPCLRSCTGKMAPTNPPFPSRESQRNGAAPNLENGSPSTDACANSLGSAWVSHNAPSGASSGSARSAATAMILPMSGRDMRHVLVTVTLPKVRSL